MKVSTVNNRVFNPWKYAGCFKHLHEKRSLHNQTLILLLVLKDKVGHVDFKLA